MAYTSDSFVLKILDGIKNSLETDESFVALHRPIFTGNEWKYVKDCLDTGWVSSVGKYVDQLENDLASFTGADKTIAVVNGTAALHIALLLVGVKPNDEVLMPALSFVATANAVSYCGAIPHFVESDEATLGIDPHKLRAYLLSIAEKKAEDLINRNTGGRIRAVVPMHTFGHPTDIEGLLLVCREFGLELVEDAAESLGSYYNGKHTGTFGKVAAISFNGNKILTTGGGGALLTNDLELARRAKHITTTAKLPHKWDFFHDQIGFNYRMPNINAALGVAQLENLPYFLSQKRALAERYKSSFNALAGVKFFEEPKSAKSNYWLNALVLDNEYSHLRDEVLEVTNAAGIMTRPVWKLLNTLPMYAHCPSMDLTVANSLEKRIINLPSSVGI